ncbi:unnamed protein product [Brassicogethes aeneus]|uniref:Uncharacterized protein n=1 Tax=Brassicogethes aeneus TaxID=1431903 RepID=A0A9P0AYA4_BRAAE|nr:unnamed protein product [Brassicogethes aeneus]
MTAELVINDSFRDYNAIKISISIWRVRKGGHHEKFGSLHNENYLMSLELIAEFHPFLADHISRFGNKGIGSTSYVSKTICEEFIQILASKVMNVKTLTISKKKAFDFSINQEYKTLVSRVRRRKTMTTKQEPESERCSKHEKINEKLSVLIDLENLDNVHIREKAKNLQEAFSQDLETSRVDELIHFKPYLI